MNIGEKTFSTTRADRHRWLPLPANAMKNNTMHRSVVVIAILAAGSMIGCGPAHYIGNSEIPTAKTLRPIMWSQAALADPAFKKIGAPAYHDADWTAFTALGERLQISSVKLKQDFSKGEDWNALADALGLHARELVGAAKTNDPQAASAALTATRTTCRACHKEFR
jgi:hypothetical protein